MVLKTAIAVVFGVLFFLMAEAIGTPEWFSITIGFVVAAIGWALA